MENWHYAENGQQQGPVSLDQLQQKISSGQIPVTAKVWKQGMADWAVANTLPEFQNLNPGEQPIGASPYAAPSANPAGGVNFSGGSAPGPMPTTFLWQSIVATLCCCPPCGIVSIVFAAQVETKYTAGDYHGAVKASNNAKTWFFVSLGLGLVFGIGWFLLNFLAIAAGGV